MRGRTRFALVVVGLLAAATPSFGQAKLSVRSTKPQVVEHEPARVVLLEAGAEPRALLRLRPEVGVTQRAEMVMTLAMSVSANGGAPRNADVPAMVVTLDATPTRVEPGTIAWEYVFSGARIEEDGRGNAQMRATMKASCKEMVGFKGKVEMSDLGIVRRSEFVMPRGATGAEAESLRQSMAQMSLPLPGEPVGVGATWRVDMAQESKGIKSTSTMTYTLRSLEGDVVVLDVAYAQTAPPQNVPAELPGATMRLSKLSATGSGTTNFSLSRVLPGDMKMNLATDMRVESKYQGRTQRGTQKIAADIRMRTPALAQVGARPGARAQGDSKGGQERSASAGER